MPSAGGRPIAGDAVVHQRSRPQRGVPGRTILVPAVVALLLLVPALVSGQDVLRRDLTAVGQFQPINLTADEIQTWTQSGTRVLLLRGNVLAKQGETTISMALAVAWIDEAGQARTGVYMVDLYGEPNVELKGSGETHKAMQGVISLATRGDVKIAAIVKKVQETPPQLDDPDYRRAQANRVAGAAPPPQTGIQQIAARVAVPADPPPGAPVQVAQIPAPQPQPPTLPAPGNVLPTLPPANPPPATAPPVVPAPVAPSPVVPAPVVPAPVVPAPGVPAPGVVPAIEPAPMPPAPPPVTIGPIGGAKKGDAAASAGPRNLTIRPRSSVRNELETFKSHAGDETAYVYTGGLIVTVSLPDPKKGVLDIEGDRVVVWTKGNPEGAAQRLQTPEGETTNQMEFYVAGHVEMRYTGNKGETETLYADEVYYDVSRNVAIGIRGELVMRDPKLPYPLHMKAPIIYQLNAKTFEAGSSDVFSTVLPSDPGLKVELRKTRVIEKQEIRTDIFGFPHTDPKTGEPLVETERYFTGRDIVVRLEGVPIFYWPYYTANVEEPLGPLRAISGNYNKIFGFALYSTWDVYSLLGMRRPTNTGWQLYLDYMTARGPAIGSSFNWSGTDLFSLPGKFDNITKFYTVWDHGQDIIGSGGSQVPVAAFGPLLATAVPGAVPVVGPLEVPISHPNFRGRFFERFNAYDLPEGFGAQVQVAQVTDPNFMQQYYQWEYLNDLNQETYVYLKQQQDNWMWNLLVEPTVMPWYTKDRWLPKADGFLLGETFFDRFIYNARASVAYAQLRPTDQAPFAYLPTDVRVNTGRFDLWQEVSLPFQLGAFKVVPYVVGDVAYYTAGAGGDLATDATREVVPAIFSQGIPGGAEGRLYGGGGLRASVPFSKLYPDIQSEVLNVDGIYHKMVLSGNYYYAYSSIDHNRLPQLDRLNDDVTDFTLRDMHVLYPSRIPGIVGTELAYSPVYNTQDYAIRRLLDTRIDTLDTMETLQFDLRQRWQTKRGFPGNEHVVDWMTLDVSASLFPDAHRDDYGHMLGFVDYDWLWNIGDRTALFSNGWFEPYDTGARVFAFGATINRPDSTNFLISYRQLDPLGSRAIIGQITFPFSAKYALTASTTWDFGVHNQVYTLLLTRKGTDVLVGVGISYNSILSTFGFTFEVVPNLLLSRLRPGTAAAGAGAMMGMSNPMGMGLGR
jgi:hypothetical protein